MIRLTSDAALLIIDVQRDFCPGGSLAVPDGDAVVTPLNRAAALFGASGLPVIASRDWHPEESGHFLDHGGAWPVHCVRDTPGAAFHPGLRLPAGTVIVSKGMGLAEDAYSAYQGVTGEGLRFATLLLRLGIRTLVVGGLATDYCVRASVLDALQGGIRVLLLRDAIRGVDLKPGDSRRALEEMQAQGAVLVGVDELSPPGTVAGHKKAGPPP